MNILSFSKRRVSSGVASLAVVGIAVLGMPLAASADAASVVTVNGVSLGSTALSSGNFTVAANAPVGVGVKFKLDSTYLGEDKVAPYSWPISTGAGTHTIDARWDLDGRQETTITFVVSPASSPTPTMTPTRTPTPTVSAKFVLSVAGAPIADSTQPSSMVVAVNAPGGSEVRFRMDGSYLGKDDSAPFSWPVSAGTGIHKIDARWDGGEVESQFAVGVAAPGSPDQTPPVVTPPTDPSTGTPGTGTGTTVVVSTSAQLISALSAAKAGQTISLTAGNYVGKFESAASGTAAAPIILTGSRNAVLSTGDTSSGYGLHITGSYWRIQGLSVTKSAKGIVLDGSTHTVISGVDVGMIGAEAVHFRHSSSDGVIEDSVIHDTGKAQAAYGEGVYMGSAKSNWGSIMGSSSTPDLSDHVTVRNNHISNTTAEGIDVKEGTTGGSIIGNVFSNAGFSGQNFADSWVDIKGNRYDVSGNSGTTTKLDAFQVHGVLTGWGRSNVFSANTVLGGVPGYEVWIQSASLENVVVCKTSNAAKGLSNVLCVP